MDHLAGNSVWNLLRYKLDGKFSYFEPADHAITCFSRWRKEKKIILKDEDTSQNKTAIQTPS